MRPPACRAPPGPAPRRARRRAATPRIEAWKQRLLDTTLRNRLINFKDTKQASSCCARSSAPSRTRSLRATSSRPCARARRCSAATIRAASACSTRASGDVLDQFLRERLAHGELHATQPDRRHSDRLTTIYRAARDALEETGTNTLCLALGMIHWYEAETSEQARRAPILLLPVDPCAARARPFAPEATGEDARLNVTLFEKLRHGHGDHAVDELAELPLDEAGVDVPAVLRRVREAIVNLPRWEVKDELHLGLFSFAKFAMWADLEHNLDALLASPVDRAPDRRQGRSVPERGRVPRAARDLDARPPAELVCPLDADASQLAAVAAATGARRSCSRARPAPASRRRSRT